jgi:hypothetical protein
MITTILLASAISTSPIIKDGMTEAERLAAIRPFLHPPPGSTITAESISINEQRHNKNPLFYKLYITVSPPKGACFVVTRNPNIPDQRICKTTPLAVPLGEISADGSFSWTISTGAGDFGYQYTWKTPHRIAQKIPAGTNQAEFIPVHSCVAHTNAAGKRVILNLLNGERWAMTFPETDQFEEQPAAVPNLYISSSVPTGGINKESTVKPTRADPWAYLKNIKPGDPVTLHWAIPARNHYVMGASNFKITDSAPGMTGKCRYQYSGAANDPESGWIECHEVDTYDVIFVHLTCSSQLIK